MWFCRQNDVACALSLDVWILANFRLRAFELGPRSHLHSEEWMCFFEPDASFRDLQRLHHRTGTFLRAPSSRVVRVASRTFGRRGCPFEHPGESALRPILADPSDHPARRAVSLPDDQARDPVPSDPKGRSPPPNQRWRHDSRACRSTASKGEEGTRLDSRRSRDRSEASCDVAPFVTSPATVCTVQSLLDSLPSPSCRA